MTASRLSCSTEFGSMLAGLSAPAVAEAMTAIPMSPIRIKARKTPRQEANVNLKNCPMVSIFAKWLRYYMCEQKY